MVDILQTKNSIIKSQTTETVSNENEINHSQHCKMSFKRYFYVPYNFRVLYNFSMVYFSCNYL